MMRARTAGTVFLLFATLGRAHGVDIATPQDYVLPAGETASNELFLSTITARIEGHAADDVFAVAQKGLDIPGLLGGDAWLMARTVNLDGSAADHVRGLAETFTVRGDLARGLAVMATTVHLATGSVVHGYAAMLGEHVMVEGRIEGPAQLLAQSVTLGGDLGGDVRLVAQDIVVLPGTRIGGNLIYTAPRELFLDHSVQLGGELIRRAPDQAGASARSWADRMAFKVLQFAASFLAGLPLILLFPRLTGRATRLLRHATPRVMMTGLAALFVLPLAAVAAFISVIGIPLALMVAAFYGILLYIAKVVVALALGAVVLQRPGPQSRSAVVGLLALGLFLLYAFASLPVVGGSVALLIGIMGLGALSLALLGADARRPPAREPAAAPDSSAGPA